MLNRHTIGLFAVIFSAVFLLFVSSAHAGMIIQHPNYTGLNQGLVGYWSFDGKDMSGTTAYDRSGQGNNGTLTNGPTKTIGKLGQALQLDGVNDFISIPQNGKFNVSTSAFTISLWINDPSLAANLTPGSNFQRIVSWYDGTNNIQLGIGSDNSVTRQFYVINTTIVGTAPISTGAVTAGYHHVVATYNGSGYAMYVDGLSSNGTPLSGSGISVFTGNSTTLYIGQRGDGARWTNGIIDDARIYNRALNQDEIKRLYKIGGTLHTNTSINNDSLTKGLVGYWSFDGKDMSGTTAYDRSGQGNNGTLTNGPVKTIGKLGQALSFDGVDDGVQTALTSNNDIHTYSMWIFQKTIGGNGLGRIFDKRNSGDTEIELLYTNSHVSCSGSPSGFGCFEFSRYWSLAHPQWNFVIPSANAWHHIVVIYDGTSPENIPVVYEDGMTVAVINNGAAPSGTLLTNTSSYWIGNRGSGDRAWDGQIDDVRIYSRVLTADEIKRLYKIGGTLHTNTSINNDSLTKGLVGYWSFDGKDMSGTTAYDRSGQGNNGTLTNGPVKTIGKLGQALNFDGGSNYINVGSASSLDNLGPVTYSAWIKPSTSIASQNGHITTKGSFGGSGTSAFLVWNVSNQLALRFQKDYSTATDLNVVSSNNSINVDQWQHVTATWDSSDSASGVHLYINGSEVAYQTQQNPSGIKNSDASASLFIGDDNTSDDIDFNGSIDDVRIYNRVLTPAEIQRLYNLGR